MTSGIRTFCQDAGGTAESGPWAWHGTVPGGLAVIVLEPTEPAAADAGRLVMATIRSALHEGGTTLTARLLAGLAAASQRLLARNEALPRPERCAVAVTVAVIRGDQVLLGQAGPAMAWIQQDGAARSLAIGHEDSGNGRGWPGFDAGVAVDAANLRSLPLASLGQLVLGPSSIAPALGEDDLGRVLAGSLDDAAGALYRALREMPDVGVAVLDAALLPVTPAEDLHRVTAPPRPAAKAVPPGETGPVEAAVAGPEAAGDGGPAGGAAGAPPRSRRARRAPAPPGAGSGRRKALLAVGLAAVVLVALAVAIGQGIAARTPDDPVLAARSSLAQAAAATDRDQARRSLQDALRHAQQAVDTRPADLEALLVYDEVVEELRGYDGIVPLVEVRQLADARAVGGIGSSLDEIFLVRSTLNLLDASRGRLLATVVSGRSDGFTVLASAEPGNTTGPGRIARAFPLPEGGVRTTAGIGLTDGERRFWALENSGLRPLAVRGTAAWRDPKAYLGYAGNLYVLDPPAGQVWRYFPTESGFDSEPRGLLPVTSISGAVDMAIDGSIYVLGPTWIRKFTGGVEEPFRLEGLDRPMLNPAAISTSPDQRYIYVADQGNRRILVFDKQGRFHRQFISEVIRSPSAVEADERNFRLYILSDNTVFQTNLPLG